jgi:hypothetical protein
VIFAQGNPSDILLWWVEFIAAGMSALVVILIWVARSSAKRRAAQGFEVMQKSGDTKSENDRPHHHV